MAHAIRHDFRKRLTELYGPRIDRLLLFGSQARGEAVEGSDVDVLVVLHGEVQPGEEIRRTGGIVAELSLANDQVISCAFVSSQRFMSEKSPFLLNVRREGIALWLRIRNYLLKKSRDSLHAARLLLQEEMYDFSASRSYYAMFYAVQALLFSRDLSFSKHSAVIAAFGREFAK